MRLRFGLTVAALLSLTASAWAQAPTPLGSPLPPPGPLPGSPPPGPPAAGPPPEAAAPEGREFCHQSVSFSVAPPDSVPDAYRAFVGIFSDAAWNPQLCAALIVENVTHDGAATIIYVDGPMGGNGRGTGRVLNGTGVIQQGELKFQNSDGTQFSFKPFYSDLDGHLVTPKGQAYQTIFKRSF
ncbi:MAG TPA: hypothetical protein VGG57_01760 [Stellaceae bacterium]|jgi:hypothetical protein